MGVGIAHTSINLFWQEFGKQWYTNSSREAQLCLTAEQFITSAAESQADLDIGHDFTYLFVAKDSGQLCAET